MSIQPAIAADPCRRPSRRRDRPGGHRQRGERPERAASAHTLPLELIERPIAGAAIEAEGCPLPETTLQLCRDADAVLFGAAGLPRYDHLRGNERPGAAIHGLRQRLGLSINLRPVRAFPALSGCGPLRPEVTRGTDFIVVRELSAGAYYGAHGRTGEGARSAPTTPSPTAATRSTRVVASRSSWRVAAAATSPQSTRPTPS